MGSRAYPMGDDTKRGGGTGTKDTGCFTEDGTGKGLSMGVSDTRLGTKVPSLSRMPASIAYFRQMSTWWHFGRATQGLQRQLPLDKRLTVKRFPPVVPDCVVALVEKTNRLNVAVSLMRKTGGWGSGERVGSEANTLAFTENRWTCRQLGHWSGQSQTP